MQSSTCFFPSVQLGHALVIKSLCIFPSIHTDLVYYTPTVCVRLPFIGPTSVPKFEIQNYIFAAIVCRRRSYFSLPPSLICGVNMRGIRRDAIFIRTFGTHSLACMRHRSSLHSIFCCFARTASAETDGKI